MSLTVELANCRKQLEESPELAMLISPWSVCLEIVRFPRITLPVRLVVERKAALLSSQILCRS
jgi:hypothetical protein